MKTRIIKVIIVFSIIIMVIIGMIMVLSIRNRDKRSNNNSYNNIISSDNINESNQEASKENNNNINTSSNVGKGIDEIEETDPWGENNPITEENLKLKQITDSYSYFLVKQCISKFYSSKENAYNVLPTELKQYDVSSFYGKLEEPNFCINTIYRAHVRASRDIYVVYYRLEAGNNQCSNLCSIVKIDNKNLSFEIYPLEYLKTKNMSNLKENDLISLDIIKNDDIEKTEYNHYRIDDINTSEAVCIREIFERCSFDYQFDKNHLFTVLNENYRNTRFQNIDEFINYLNTTNVLKGNIKDYQSEKANEGIQYILRGSYNNYYVVNYNNIMNYNLILDEYTILSQKYLEVYNSSFPTVQAKSCIDRVRRAIDDKNYRFIYEKYNITQKNKDFQNYTDFVNFIKQSFYEQNTFEYLDFENITNSIYKYQVKITDASEKVLSYRKVFMTVTLKDNADFEINITK